MKKSAHNQAGFLFLGPAEIPRSLAGRSCLPAFFFSWPKLNYDEWPSRIAL
jgi:hypothetical protein